MKKAFILAAFAMCLANFAVTAQTKQKTNTEVRKTKIKPTTTVGEKVHNITHKRNKASGWKYKNKNKITGKKTKVESVKKD